MNRKQLDDLADFDPTVPLVFLCGCAFGAFIFYAFVQMTGGW